MEATIARLEKENLSPQITVILDRRGMTAKNRDNAVLKFTMKFIKMLQDYYAERLALLYVVGANWVYKTLYAMVKPFLGERTKAKIIIVDENLK